MHDRGLAEWLLKRAAGAERGTAIYGDLVELAATRSTTWFCFAYARTVLSLTWRTVLGIVIGATSFDALASLLKVWDYFAGGGSSISDGFVFGFVFGSFGMGPVLSSISQALWFVVPYIAIRYGFRDRMVHLGGALFLLNFAAVADGDFSVRLTVICATILLAGALCSKTWRRPATVLVATVAASALAVGSLPHIALPWNVVAALTMLLTVLACSYAHRRLFQPRQIGVLRRG